MYTPATVQDCLSPTIGLVDAAIYSETYLTEATLAKAIPVGTDVPTVLTSVLSGSITKMLGDVIRIKKITNNVRSVIDDFTLFEGKADPDQKNANRGRFVGLILNLKTNNDIGLKIFRLAFHADMSCPGMNFYLFNSELVDPISVTPFDYNTPGSVKWLNVALPITSDDGLYYLGYFESDMALGAQSLKKTLDFVNQPICTTCNEGYYVQYMKRVKYLNIQPFYVDENNLSVTAGKLFDTDKVNFVDFNNWGINIKVTVSCDISDFVCRNNALFYDALSMRYAVDLLTYILMNTRDSGALEKIKSGIIFTRDGDKANGTPGLSAKYEEIIDALNVDLSGFNAMCLPCVMNPGVKKKYIG